MELKWKPSKCKGVECFAPLRYKHKKTGDGVTGKTRQTWETRLSIIFKKTIDLTQVTGFYKDWVTNFIFEVDGTRYRIIEDSMERPTIAHFHLQKFFPVKE